MYKCFYRWRETNILKVFYIAFARNLILSFNLRPIEDMSNDKKETASITTFKKWSFANKFRIETIAPKWNTMISCERQGLETLKDLL